MFSLLENMQLLTYTMHNSRGSTGPNGIKKKARNTPAHHQHTNNTSSYMPWCHPEEQCLKRTTTVPILIPGSLYILDWKKSLAYHSDEAKSFRHNLWSRWPDQSPPPKKKKKGEHNMNTSTIHWTISTLHGGGAFGQFSHTIKLKWSTSHRTDQLSLVITH